MTDCICPACTLRSTQDRLVFAIQALDASLDDWRAGIRPPTLVQTHKNYRDAKEAHEAALHVYARGGITVTENKGIKHLDEVRKLGTVSPKRFEAEATLRDVHAGPTEAVKESAVRMIRRHARSLLKLADK